MNTAEEYFKYFYMAVNYIKKLKVFRNGVLIDVLKSQQKTAFLGFLVALDFYIRRTFKQKN